MIGNWKRIAGGFRPIAPLAAAAFVLAACESSTDVDDNGNGHQDAARVEIETRGPASALLAVWRDGEGWTDADGNAITELPNPVDVEGAGLQPLTAGGTRASLTVRFVLPDGMELDMGTLNRDEPTGERECTEYSARYYPLDNDETIIAWPNMPHPDGPLGAFQFARRHTGEMIGIFHCNHIHLYPEAPGTAELEFHLWHVDHSDAWTDPITIRVEPAAEPARIELETRGPARILLGAWTAAGGWVDADGNAIGQIAAPREVEGVGLVPLIAGGANASLTLRYIAHGGAEATMETLDRDDVTRERVCSYVSGHYDVVGSTNVIAWPNIAHPDAPGGDAQFAVRSDDEVVGIFHCNHIHFYPEAAGEVSLRMVIQGGNRPLVISDPIGFVVEEN